MRAFIKKTILHNWQKDCHINRALASVCAGPYLEIGVRDGLNFRRIKAPLRIGVDPERQKFDWPRRGELFFQMTSDEFFEKEAGRLFSKQKLSVALVDGLHEFTQALRDIHNIEKHIRGDGVIFIHDCNPAARRNADDESTWKWNGDVWKVAVFLRKHRPDLQFFTLNCSYGLGVVRGFASRNRSFRLNGGDISACKDLDYSYLQRHRRRLLDLKPVAYSKAAFPPRR